MNKKLLEFQKKIQAIKKDAKNPHFKNNYATLTQILSEVKPILSECGLVLLQPTFGGKCQTILLDAESDAQMISEIDLPINLNPQQLGSALTYYRRYLLAGMLSLELEDDDANMASKPQVRPTIDNDRFQKALEQIEAGKYTVEALKSNFTLNKDQLSCL